MKRIGILGDIGSGKSYIAKCFGFPVFNADLEVAKIYKENKKVFQKLKKELPLYFDSFPIKKKEIIGKKNKTKSETPNQISLHVIIVNKKTINTGKINSAADKPSQVILKALPLVFSKNLETVVVAVCDISPCPLNLNKKIPIKRKGIALIVEKK